MRYIPKILQRFDLYLIAYTQRCPSKYIELLLYIGHAKDIFYNSATNTYCYCRKQLKSIETKCGENSMCTDTEGRF